MSANRRLLMIAARKTTTEPVRHDSASIQRVEDPSRFGLQEPSSYPDGGKRRKGGH
ncbi:MAG: hypothetical protein V1899_07490 [Planctomycetota bacterium]